MSLTADLLFGTPPSLPKGRVITYDAGHRKQPPTQGQQDQAARNRATRAANIERVYNVIAEAGRPLSMLEIADQSDLSRITVLNAVEELENPKAWQGGARIVRHRGVRHLFEVVRCK